MTLLAQKVPSKSVAVKKLEINENDDNVTFWDYANL